MRAGFPHSEILGSKLACQLPEAYRRLQRPSSPVVAKASTTCTYSLDPITLSTNHGRWTHRITGSAFRDQGRLSPGTRNAIFLPSELGQSCRPNSFHFIRIFKEQPNYKITAKHTRPKEHDALRADLDRELVEPTGIEPVTSCLQSRRSPS